MAVQLPVLEVSLIAEEDLTNYQYHFVSLSTTDGYVKAVDSTSEQVIGVLQNTPNVGETAAVMIIGITKVVAGVALNAADVVDAEYISATDSGKAIVYVSGGEKLGIVMLSASAEDKYATVLLTI
jgi:hypothetical protein